MKIGVNVSIPKGLPIEQIDNFVDRVVYNTALITKEETKKQEAYPFRTGLLSKTEFNSQIVGSNKEYGLIAGVDYAVDVWGYPQNTNWTNPRTQAQWYETVYKNNKEKITDQAVRKALSELKK